MRVFWRGETRSTSGSADNIRKFPQETLPIDRDLPSAARDQPCAFGFLGSICDGSPRDAQHLGE
jgi:hypothetical protein